MKKTWKLVIVLIFIAIAILVFFTLKPKDNDITEIKVQLASNIEVLDSQLAVYDTTFEVLACINEGLMKLDTNGNVTNGIAESYSVSDDGLVYIFNLRDAKWSNDSSVTANDFKFAWLRALNPKTGAEYAYLMTSYIKNADNYYNGKCEEKDVGIKVINDKTLEVTLEAPCSFFTALTYLPIYQPLNQLFFENCGDKYATNTETILSNGPFILKEYEPTATTIKLSKNPSYWDSKNINLQGIQFTVIEDSQQAALAYENNEIDVINISSEQVEKYKDSNIYNKVNTSILWYICPNMNVEVLKNENLRKAITTCINRNEIASNILGDGSVAANYVVPSNLTYNSKGEDFRDVASVYNGYDLEQAKLYWNKAKEELKISDLTITMTYTPEDRIEDVCEYIKEEIEKNLEGLKINLSSQSRENRVDDMISGKYELTFTRWGADFSDPTTYLDLFITGNESNYGNWSNKNYDDIMKECASSEYIAKQDERWNKLVSAEKIVMDNAAVFPVYQQGNSVIIRENIKGLEFHSVAYNRIYSNVSKK